MSQAGLLVTQVTPVPPTTLETITTDNGVATAAANNINLFAATNAGATASFSAAVDTIDFNITDSAIGQNTILGLDSGNGAFSGTNNTSLGYQTLLGLTTGDQNTALGTTALGQLQSGANNIAVGNAAGTNYTTSESSNIVISNAGVVGESNTIRIGTTGASAGEQNRFFMAGVDGVNVGSVAKVLTMASEQVGTATITAGTGITVTPGANTITIESTVTSIFPWTEITAASQAMSVNNGYIANNAGTINFSLPATAAVGSIIRVTGINNATGWQITQAAGQRIFFGTTPTTLGVGGSLSSINTRDSVELVCVVADTTYNVLSSIGNLTVV